MIVVDSSIWIDFFNGQHTPGTAHLSQMLGHEHILVGDLILCEVLQGARSTKHANEFEVAMRQCEFIEMCDVELAVAAAARHRELRAKGITVRKTIDMLIGTYCIMHRHKLLHADRDFDPMERYLGLQVVPTHYMVNEPMVAYG
jgi:predicted nucleic acid-binding protein